jgi:hypothetical protein
MIAILTKYLGPTDTKGSRYKAYTSNGQSITLDADHRKDYDLNHDAAAKALCQKMGWKGSLVRGGIETGFAYVFTRRDYDGNVAPEELIYV